MDRARVRRSAVGALVALGLIAAVGSGVFVCPTAFLFGIPCPGCGLTRATLALLHGDVAESLRFHPLAAVLVPLLGLMLAASLFEYVRGDQGPRISRLSGPAGVALACGVLVVTLGVWGARFAGYFGGPVPVEDWRALLENSTRPHEARR